MSNWCFRGEQFFIRWVGKKFLIDIEIFELLVMLNLLIDWFGDEDFRERSFIECRCHLKWWFNTIVFIIFNVDLLFLHFLDEYLDHILELIKPVKQSHYLLLLILPYIGEPFHDRLDIPLIDERLVDWWIRLQSRKFVNVLSQPHEFPQKYIQCFLLNINEIFGCPRYFLELFILHQYVIVELVQAMDRLRKHFHIFISLFWLRLLCLRVNFW